MARSHHSQVATADRSWITWMLIGIAAIWVGVLAISVAAPDLVSGSEHEHLPLAAITTWIWGLIATVGLLWGMSKLRGNVARKRLWIGLVTAAAVIWGVALVLSVALPVWETGSDPTERPIRAIVVPRAASMLTLLASVIVGIISESPERQAVAR